MIVEFVGTPGVGKTTLATALVAMLDERGIAATDITGAARDHVRRTRPGHLIDRGAPPWARELLLWQVFYALGLTHAIRFGVERPVLVRHAVRSQLRRGLPFRTRAHVLYWFVHLCGRYRFLRATSTESEVLVLDDGFAQRAVHLFASPFDEPDAAQVTDYVDLLPAPDLLIVVLAGWRECERRVRERGVWPHARHLTSTQLSRYVEHSERVVDVATRRARERGWRIAEISTEDTPDGSDVNAPLAQLLVTVEADRAGSRSVDGRRSE
jgi:hypothetical protein